MTIELPDNALGSLRLTNQEARIDLACGLYAAQKVTMGQAAKVAGIPYAAFMRKLGERGICMNYSVEDARQDAETVRQRLGR